MTDKQEILDIPQHLRRDTVTDDVQAMLNAANVMDAQSALITKLESKLKDRDMLYEAGITAAREEIAELQGVIEKLREVVPKLVEVAEGGISTTSTTGAKAMSDKQARNHHAVKRTSPKGSAFIGRCWKCGKENIDSAMSQTDECPVYDNYEGESIIQALQEQKP